MAADLLYQRLLAVDGADWLLTMNDPKQTEQFITTDRGLVRLADFNKVNTLENCYEVSVQSDGCGFYERSTSFRSFKGWIVDAQYKRS